MDIKTLLGDAYKEGMSVDDINAALADKTLVDPSTLPASVSKKTYDQTATDLATAKKRIKELENANLSADEKLQQALKDAETSRVDFVKKSVRLDVEKVLIEGGLTQNDYADIIDSMVSEDQEKSVDSAKKFMSVISAQRAATEQKVKAELMKNSPRPDGGSVPGSKGADYYTKLIENARSEGDIAAVAYYTRLREQEKSN